MINKKSDYCNSHYEKSEKDILRNFHFFIIALWEEAGIALGTGSSWSVIENWFVASCYKLLLFLSG